MIPGWGTNKVPHAMCSEENLLFNPVKKKKKKTEKLKKRRNEKDLTKKFLIREREVLLENNTAVTANRTEA